MVLGYTKKFHALGLGLLDEESENKRPLRGGIWRDMIRSLVVHLQSTTIYHHGLIITE